MTPLIYMDETIVFCKLQPNCILWDQTIKRENKLERVTIALIVNMDETLNSHHLKLGHERPQPSSKSHCTFSASWRWDNHEFWKSIQVVDVEKTTVRFWCWTRGNVGHLGYYGLSWKSFSWIEGVTKETIINCWKHCGLAPDGTEFKQRVTISLIINMDVNFEFPSLDGHEKPQPFSKSHCMFFASWWWDNQEFQVSLQVVDVEKTTLKIWYWENNS